MIDLIRLMTDDGPSKKPITERNDFATVGGREVRWWVIGPDEAATIENNTVMSGFHLHADNNHRDTIYHIDMYRQNPQRFLNRYGKTLPAIGLAKPQVMRGEFVFVALEYV